MKRRDFVKTMALSGMAVAASDHRRRPDRADAAGQGARVEVQGPLRHRAAARPRRRAARYADIRFTRNTNSGVNANGGNREFDGFGGFGGGGGRGGGRGGGAAVAAVRRASAAAGGAGPSGAAGFGVRVIHSGVWGFASSPIVTEDEIRRITRMATEVAKASAIAKRRTSGSRRCRPTSSTGRRRWSEGPAQRCRRTTSRRSSRRSSTSSSRPRK